MGQTNGVANNRIASVWAGSTVTYSYDAMGNVTSDGTHSYQYDAENRLVAVDGGTTATYTYDHQNRRVKSVAGANSIHYVWEGNQVLAEHDVTNGAVKVDYIYSNGQMVAKEETGAAETYYFLSDRLSIRAVLGYSTAGGWQWRGRQGHLPFGEGLGVSGSADKHRFTTYERDNETGLDYAVNRYNATGVARFMSVDPLYDLGRAKSGGHGCNIGQGKVNPQRWNRFLYTINNPTNQVDPQGLDPMPNPDPFNPTITIATQPRSRAGCGRAVLIDGFETAFLDFLSCNPISLIPAPMLGDVTIRHAVSTYRYQRWLPIIGGWVECIYKLDCPLKTRASCGFDIDIVITKNPNNCKRFWITHDVYAHVFGFDECVRTPIYYFSDTPEDCS